MSNRILYVKPCWGVFRDGDRRTLAAYPSSADAIRHALQGNGNVEIVVLNEVGKATERLTRTPSRERYEALAEPKVTDEMVKRALVAHQDCPGNDETWAESAPRAMRAALEAALR